MYSVQPTRERGVCDKNINIHKRDKTKQCQVIKKITVDAVSEDA